MKRTKEFRRFQFFKKKKKFEEILTRGKDESDKNFERRLGKKVATPDELGSKNPRRRWRNHAHRTDKASLRKKKNSWQYA